MFKNIGKKIQVLAKTLCWIGIAISIIFGLAFIIVGIAQKQILISLGGIAVAFIYAIFCWLGSFIMVGYGELVEKVNNIDNKLSPPQAEAEVID